MLRRFNFKYYVKEGFSSVFTHGLMSFAAVCMIVACLLIMGSFTLIAVNVERMLGNLEAENEFVAYIDEAYTREQALAVEDGIKAIENVSTTTFVTREEALEQFLEGRQDNELLDGIPSTVLRDRYRIHVHDIEQMEDTVNQVKLVVGVANTNAAVEIAQGFVIIRNIATVIAMVLVAILMILSLFIISNTIRLATFYRREEIAIMKMCGATDAFVSWPFVVEGMILGLVGALLAFFMQWGVYRLVENLTEKADGFNLVTIISYETMAVRIVLIFVGTGLAIGVVGSLLAIRKFLRV